MPPLIVTETDTTAFVKFVSAFMLMVSIAALASIWFSQRSVLDLWLLIVALAWLLSSILSNFVGVRFDVAWYANRNLRVCFHCSISADPASRSAPPFPGFTTCRYMRECR